MKKAVIFILLITTFCLSFISSIRRSFADDASIYYFTDNMSDANSFKNYLINTSNYSSSDIVIVDWTNGFIDKMSLFNGQMNYQDYEDSYLIFEFTSGINWIGIKDDVMRYSYFFSAMENSFSELKDNNNQIAFICGYDETLLFNKTSFLNYVDFHINLDKFSVFKFGALYDIDQYLSSEVDDCTVLLDFALINEVINSGYEWAYHLFFDDYISYCIRMGKICNTNNINNLDLNIFLGINYNMEYTNVDVSGYCNVYSNNIEIEDIEFNSNIFIVAATSTYYNLISGTYYYCDFINFVDDINPISVFTYDRYNLATEDGCYLVMNPNTSITIEEMLLDFVTDEDISIYNNYDGVCAVSHKMLEVSEDDDWPSLLLGLLKDFVYDVYDFEESEDE